MTETAICDPYVTGKVSVAESQVDEVSPVAFWRTSFVPEVVTGQKSRT